jgi:hypothetical protein
MLGLFVRTAAGVISWLCVNCDIVMGQFEAQGCVPRAVFTGWQRVTPFACCW